MEFATQSTVDKRMDALKRTGKSLTEIAQLLKINRGTIYHNLKMAELSDRFKRDLKEFVGVDLDDSGQHRFVKKEGVPYYNVSATAGNGGVLDESKPEHASSFIKIPGFDDCECFLNVFGDSMAPRYKSGEIVGLKRITDREQIAYGEVYMIVTDQQRVIKYLFPGKDETKWRLKSENSELFPDFEIKSEKVIHLFQVKGKISRDCL